MTNISYELAKELKEAGFPQEHTLWVYYEVQTGNNPPHQVLRIRRLLDGYAPHEVLGYVAAPNLSELIEACGEDFIHLKKVGDKWEAKVRLPDGFCESVFPRPGQSVAQGWLALNKK